MTSIGGFTQFEMPITTFNCLWIRFRDTYD